MRKQMKWIYIIMCCVLSACSKAPINRNIEGHWRVDSIEREDGSVEYHQNMFYTLKLWVVEVADKSEEKRKKALIGRLEFVDDHTLKMYDFKVRTGAGDNKTDATAEELHYYGLLKHNVVEVVSSGRKLELRQGATRIRLTRF